jgi:hypothetical protein
MAKALTFAISWGGILVVAGPDGIPLQVTRMALPRRGQSGQGGQVDYNQ